MRIAFHAVGCLSVAHSILRSNFADLCTLDEGYYGTDTYFSFDLPYVLRHYARRAGPRRAAHGAGGCARCFVAVCTP